jgi:hypothetical protein
MNKGTKLFMLFMISIALLLVTFFHIVPYLHDHHFTNHGIELLLLYIAINFLLLVPFFPARTLQLLRISAVYSYVLAIVLYIIYEVLFQRWYSQYNIRVDLTLIYLLSIASLYKSSK